MTRLAPAGAAALAALAAWLSQGTVGVSAEGTRLALLPLTPAAAVLAAVSSGLVLLLARVGASLAPVTLLGLLLLPWLPGRVPPAFLIWSGPVAGIVWAAVLLLALASLPYGRPLTVARPRLAAGALALALFAVSAWRAAPMIPGGDEPHYLVIVQSLLLDGDLTIEDVHRRGDYRAYFPGDLAPHVQRRGRDGQIYSIHAPGLPALVAPAFALGGYPAVVVMLLLVASAGSALAWHVGWLATRRADAAWFGWAAVTLPVTAIFQSFTVYPDGVGGVIALTGVWALLRAGEESQSGSTRVLPWFLHGAALSMLPWLHSRFAVLAAGLGALILLRLSTTKNPAGKAVSFLAVPAVGALAWVGFFIAIYGTPDPSAPYAAGEIGSLRFVPGGLGGLLFDQRFGLITYAPVLLVAFGGLAFMMATGPRRRLSLELLFVLVPYLLTVTHFAMWWGGWSPPARFFAPVLPLLAVPAAVSWSAIEGRATRFVASAALVLTALASAIVVGVDRGRLAFNTRERPALWLQWLGDVVDLPAAAPLWSRDADGPLFRSAAIWLAFALVAWLLLRAADRSGRFAAGARLTTAGAAAICAVVMAASSVNWAFEGPTAGTAVGSQLRLLASMAAQSRALSLDLTRWAAVPAAALPARLTIDLSRATSGRPPGRDGAMFALPGLPAGEYRVRVSPAAGRGWVMVGVARDQFALKTVQLPEQPDLFRFPLPVRELIVRGDEDARRTVRAMTLEPVRVLRPSERVTSEAARRAVRYATATVYFLDDRSFPEPEALWVGGARESTLVLQPDTPRSSAAFLLRNGPVHNAVSLQAGAWREDLRMAAGEERRVEVPLDPTRGGVVLRVATSGGFRPSEHDPASRDGRFLGVWMKVLP